MVQWNLQACRFRGITFNDRCLELGVSQYHLLSPVELSPRTRGAIGPGIHASSARTFTKIPLRMLCFGFHAIFLGEQALFLVDYLRRELLRVLQVSHSAEAWALDFHPSLSIMAAGRKSEAERPARSDVGLDPEWDMDPVDCVV
ncbi:unnamed protein product [Effrenium voratum]|nr:unnamed protein product [Effrenium voratum]